MHTIDDRIDLSTNKMHFVTGLTPREDVLHVDYAIYHSSNRFT